MINHRQLLSPPLRRLHQGTALLGVALILFLGLLAVTPDAHARLHVDGTGHGPSHSDQSGAMTGSDDAGCVVSEFASGVPFGIDGGALLLAPLVWQTLAVRADPSLFLVSPRYLHLPERGPPGSA